MSNLSEEFMLKLLQCVGRQVIVVTHKGLFLEGLLHQVDINQNILLRNGWVFWDVGNEIPRHCFENLVIQGTDLHSVVTQRS